MKYLKKYEEVSDNLQIGDYVICVCTSFTDGKIKKFIDTNIGKYVRYITNIKDVVDDFRYAIEYDNVPPELYRYSDIFSYESGIENICLRVSRNEIIEYSKNKEDLEAIINANKYNL